MGEETTKYAKHAKMETEIIFNQESYKIIGACFEVYKEKGNGFLESVKPLEDETDPRLSIT